MTYADPTEHPRLTHPIPVSVNHNEESLNALTHAFGLALGIAGAAVLLWIAGMRGGVWEIVGCAVYAATLVAAYAASTLSHVFRRPRLRQAFRVVDQAVIFLFIAGSYTPMALTWLRGGPWWALHGLIWGVALVGFVSKAVFSHRVTSGTVSAVIYILLGWTPVIATWPLIGTVPAGLLLWILAGGLCYSAGIVFFLYDQRVRYFHAAWHLLVLAGSACHFLGNLLYCTGSAA